MPDHAAIAAELLGIADHNDTRVRMVARVDDGEEMGDEQ